MPDSSVRPETLSLHSSIRYPNGDLIAQRFRLKVGDRETDECLSFSTALEGKAKVLAGLVRLTFSAADQWFEESSPIHVHPKDPFKRIDILTSTRRIKVSVRGVVVAESGCSMHLYETGLPVRYYFPRTDVRQEVLRRSETRTKCPYKGEAEYFSVDVGKGDVLENVVWYYDRPTLECGKIEGEIRLDGDVLDRCADLRVGLVCFYNEKVDIDIDGERQEQPVSPWSKKSD